MSVYTNVLPHELDEFLKNYSLGQLQQFTGISDGIENTNYFVTTSKGQYVLTIFEQLSSKELPYFLELMAFFSEAGIPTAHPVSNNNGKYISLLKNKPAALVKRLNGASIDIPNVKQCQEIGFQMAKMHLSGERFKHSRDSSRDKVWRTKIAVLVMPKLSEAEQVLLNTELTYLKSINVNALPISIIHADLFRDNALFIDDELTGIIDFYYAYNGHAIYDLAVTVNDWCTSGDKNRDKDNMVALLNAYQGTRLVSEKERDSWIYALRLAALRFWLSRLQDKYFPRSGEITHTKNPDRFKEIIKHRSNNQDELMSVWDAY
ncbi:MAG: homoserine kinase [Gammaproteobacteria bacterium]|tara:strand:- start:355 stop:1311 length:957 start_codon:yes stop_codon:yes gene_type:complete